MLPDTHIHTAMSTDSDTPAEIMIETAIAMGMDTICITDHHDAFAPFEGFCVEPEPYLQKLSQLRAAYSGRIRVLFGIEAGMQAHLQEYYRDLFRKYTFDYVIGSLHILDGKDPYYREQFSGTDEDFYLRYLEETLQCLRHTEGIHSLGHLDYVVRYGREKEKSYNCRNYAEIIDGILQILVDRQIALEINTGGLKAGLPWPHPHPDILKRYRELGGELITLGSDAHSPEYIGYGFSEAVSVLKSAGFSEITVFHGKKVEFITV